MPPSRTRTSQGSVAGQTVNATVNQWWVFVNKSTGAAVISDQPGITPAIVRALGAKTRLQVQSHYFPGNFTNAINQAFGTLGLSGDQIPTTYQPVSGANYMGIAGNINTAPFNTGSPLSPNITHQQAQSTDQTITGAIDSIVSFLQFIAWLFHPVNFLRAAEFLLGTVFIILGLRSGFSSSRSRYSRRRSGRQAARRIARRSPPAQRARARRATGEGREQVRTREARRRGREQETRRIQKREGEKRDNAK